MHQEGISRDVQDELVKNAAKKSNDRSRGGIPYPAEQSCELLLYESWNFLFLSGLVAKNVTMHDFKTPPRRVLELGCGNGLWLIEAARRWTNTHFVGVDLAKCQPDLSRPEYDMTDFATRITWSHVDFLKPLPFDAEEFDYVRMCNIGLAVPEDEWQNLFEECARVLVPGGVNEVIEEDLIFPCGSPQKEGDAGTSMNTPSASRAIASGQSSSSLSHSSTTSTYSSERETIASSPSITESRSMDSMQSVHSSRLDSKDSHSQLQRNHEKLMQAWHGMLHRRFITPSIISVLPFYLSNYFEDVRMMPIVHILLPPNSQQMADGGIDSYFNIPGLSELRLDLDTDGTRWSMDNSSTSAREVNKTATMSTRASIHLAKTVQTVRACKAAMLQAFVEDKGYGKDEEEETILIEDFESAWAYWESDMKDRMCMRAKLHEALAWIDHTGNDRPDWRIWREQVGEVSEASSAYIGPENLCRSVRGFVGYKPKNI